MESAIVICSLYRLIPPLNTMPPLASMELRETMRIGLTIIPECLATRRMNGYYENPMPIRISEHRPEPFSFPTTGSSAERPRSDHARREKESEPP